MEWLLQNVEKLPVPVTIIFLIFFLLRHLIMLASELLQAQSKRDTQDHEENINLQQLISVTLTVVHESMKSMVESSQTMSMVSVNLGNVANEIHNSLKTAVSEAAHDRTVQSANMLKALVDTETQLKQQNEVVIEHLAELKKKIEDCDSTLVSKFDLWKNEVQSSLDKLSGEIVQLMEKKNDENNTADRAAPDVGNVT